MLLAKYKIRGWVVAGTITLLVLAGCSKKAEESAAPAPAANQAAESAPAAQPGPGGQAAPAAPRAQSQQPSARYQAPAAGAQRALPASGERAAAPPPPPPAPKVYTLASGTRVAVRTTSTITTKTNQNGDTFMATLAEPLVVENRVLAEKGADVEGVVLRSDPGGKVKGLATVQVALKSVRLADGSKVAIATSAVEQDAKSTKKKDALKVGIGAGIGAAIGAIAGGGKGAGIGAGVGGGAGAADVLLTRGDPAVIPSESLLNFTLKAPVEVTLRR